MQELSLRAFRRASRNAMTSAASTVVARVSLEDVDAMIGGNSSGDPEGEITCFGMSRDGSLGES
jgi:hypothetical protein